MGTYPTEKIRNLGIVEHGGAGKTSLAEAILVNTGMIDRLGRVDDGTTAMDFEPEEIKRKISISSAFDHCEWDGHSIHFVDTPGYGDFIGDTRACMRALDCAVVILSAISGVKVQTEEVWEWANEFEIPRIAFVNKMDKERANFLRAIDDMEKSLKARGVAIQMPIGAEDAFEGVVDLIRMKACRYAKDGSGKCEEIAIPADYQEEAQRLREHMVEIVAEAYDALTEKYLETGELSEEELSRLWAALEVTDARRLVQEDPRGLGVWNGTEWSDGRGFSTGQEQRLLLAAGVYRALNPSMHIMLLDEPTANCDAEMKSHFFSALTKSPSLKRHTVLVSMHDPLYLHYFDRVLHFENGSLMQDLRTTSQIEAYREKIALSLAGDL